MTQSSSGPKSKVRRLIEEYELDGLGDEIVERWTREEDRDSLRQLADYFNCQLLRAVLKHETIGPTNMEIENLYRNLTDDDVSSGLQTQTRTKLEQQGVDVDQITMDFVSRQAIHTYLTSFRGVTPPQDNATPAEQRDRKHNTILRLQQRLAIVTEQALTQLRNANCISLGEFDIFVQVQVHCTDCSTRRSVTELLKQGGCDCEQGTIQE